MSRRLRVYIAGPITKGDLAHNVNQATAAFKELAEAGFSPWCPQWSAFSGGAARGPVAAPDGQIINAVYAVGSVHGCGLPHGTWLDVDLPWVEVADVVLRLPGESTGADRECDHAAANGVPVFATIADLRAWAATHPPLEWETFPAGPSANARYLDALACAGLIQTEPTDVPG